MRPANRSAFTLIEILVVVGIVSLLAGLILNYSSASRDQVAIRVEQAKLAQTIIRAKSLTISTYNDPLTPCGYGVHIDYATGAYQLFAYGIPEGSSGPAQCSNMATLDPDLKVNIADNKLPANLAFKEPDAEAIEDVLFLPPNPSTRIWRYGSNTISTDGRVPLTSKSGSFAVDILVSNAGQITF